MKKIFAFLAVIIALFVAISIATTMQQADKAEGNAYGKKKLHPETVSLLDDPNYQNIITPTELNNKLNNKESVTVYFYSPLCGPCRETTPIINPIAKDLQIDLVVFNMLEFKEGWSNYSLQSTPTIIHYENGQEVQRITGKYSEEEFTWWFKEFVK